MYSNVHVHVIQFMVFMYYYRAEYECFQIELSKNYGIAEWKEDIKNCMKKAGLENIPIVFLFSDTQVSSTLCHLFHYIHVYMYIYIYCTCVYYFRSKVNHFWKTSTIFLTLVTFPTYIHLRILMLYIMV